VQIKVDGNVITLNSPDDTITVRAGEHELEVMGKNFETFTRKFTARRGKTETWSVELKPKADGTAAVRPSGRTPPAPAVPGPDYQALATGRWVPILTSLGGKVKSRGAAIRDGVLVLTHADGAQSGAVDQSIQARDLIIRAKVRKLSGQNLSLAVR